MLELAVEVYCSRKLEDGCWGSACSLALDDTQLLDAGFSAAESSLSKSTSKERKEEVEPEEEESCGETWTASMGMVTKRALLIDVLQCSSTKISKSGRSRFRPQAELAEGPKSQFSKF